MLSEDNNNNYEDNNNNNSYEDSYLIWRKDPRLLVRMNSRKSTKLFPSVSEGEIPWACSHEGSRVPIALKRLI